MYEWERQILALIRLLLKYLRTVEFDDDDDYYYYYYYQYSYIDFMWLREDCQLFIVYVYVSPHGFMKHQVKIIIPLHFLKDTHVEFTSFLVYNNTL